MARTLEQCNIPLGYGYPALLAVASALDIQDIDGNVRGNIYVALLGDIGRGKTAAIKGALASIFVPEMVVEKAVPSSDRGLATVCGDKTGSSDGRPDHTRRTQCRCRIQWICIPDRSASWTYPKGSAQLTSKDPDGTYRYSAPVSLLT